MKNSPWLPWDAIPRVADYISDPSAPQTSVSTLSGLIAVDFASILLYVVCCGQMGAVSRICKALKFSGKLLTYAGTKDKRAVTSQWCTVKQKSVEELRKFNRPLGTFQARIRNAGMVP